MTPSANAGEPIFLNMDLAACMAEIARCEREAKASQAAGCPLDAWAYRSYAQALKDAIAGVQRCPSCGRAVPRRRRNRFA